MEKPNPPKNHPLQIAKILNTASAFFAKLNLKIQPKQFLPPTIVVAFSDQSELC
jgi:hypothetical protein